MFVTIITDCRDNLTFGRQLTRASSLFKFSPIPVGVESDIEAAGSLIDILDSCEGHKGVVLVNVAPRHGSAKKWSNGTPFSYFWYKKTLVGATIDGEALSLVKKLGITDKVEVFDIPEVMDYVVNNLGFEREYADYVVETQFRSFEFLPRAIKWVLEGEALPTTTLHLKDIKLPENQVWSIDNFGNCKTTILPEDIGFEVGKEVKLANGQVVKMYKRLKDVPNGELALIIGSSGLYKTRFVELVVQGQSATERTGFKIGSRLF